MALRDEIDGFFDGFLKDKLIFKDKGVLQANYAPEEILHRGEQIKQIANILAPALRLEKPSNLFIYGKTGTGKTLSTKHIINKLNGISKERNIQLKTIYINCKLKKTADTEYRLVAQISRELGKEIPATGLPTEEVYRQLFDIIDDKRQIFILVLDEIDQLVKKAGDEILYSLTRINSELKNAQLSLLGVSNDLLFAENLDPRVKSSLSEEELLFPPYNALQLQQILKQRANKAFKNGALVQGTIEKCAAYAAREHGDARRALELLRVAGEIAEREGKTKVSIAHLDLAQEKIEKDKTLELITAQTKQFQATLYAILAARKNTKEKIFTGDVYTIYQELCSRVKLRPLTQRRLSDIIAELDMLGIINAKVISKGRYGRTREIALSANPELELKLSGALKKELGMD